MDVAAEQLRSVVERILRLKEEQDAISADIKEIYAEAKSNGFDKTTLGDLISHLRKVAKNPDQVQERSALFDLYLDAFENAPRAHTHTREEGIAA